MPTMEFIVKLKAPCGVSAERMREYIEEEIKSNIGQLNPIDPLFNLNRDSVHVTRHVSIKTLD